MNPTEPSVIAQACRKYGPPIFSVIPRLRAMYCTFLTPILAMSWAKIVFTDCAVAERRFIVPAASSAELWTSQYPLPCLHSGVMMFSSGGP